MQQNSVRKKVKSSPTISYAVRADSLEIQLMNESLKIVEEKVIMEEISLKLNLTKIYFNTIYGR